MAALGSDVRPGQHRVSESAAYTVGYALTEKKIQSFLRPELLTYAREHGIQFKRIDPRTPLPEQGPFDVIIHKLRMERWLRKLEDYMHSHPQVVVCDPPSAIVRLWSRASMLRVCKGLEQKSESQGWPGIVRVPKEAVFDGTGGTIESVVAEAGLVFPLVAKPMEANGSETSHAMALVGRREDLGQLQGPLVLQEFVNHGGVLFKVYVVGEDVTLVRRPSLPDVSESGVPVGLQQIHRVSGHAAAEQLQSCPRSQQEDGSVWNPSSRRSQRLRDNRACTCPACVHGEHPEPPSDLVHQLAAEMRHRLGLRLFNFDLIREKDRPDNYFVIDINYFPGLAKVPSYEMLFTRFMLSLVHGSRDGPRRGGGLSDEGSSA